MSDEQLYSHISWRMTFGNKSYPDDDELTDPPRYVFGRRLTNREMRTGIVDLNPDYKIGVKTKEVE